ncbi:monophosphate biosynthesis [Mycoplasmopsis californica]|uniref:DJ-1/PfpI family protein n=1 Tax=Mycoplasmopsis equigenitalium TaxID=114883 RepID=A0ABY5J0D1_9BACT|nr:DJ-1/PfpI family protein [Mycoplasmopsis equigenitalium]UUD36717.1 DJ-1/PfpI family protein [Mycoplasmopsis equigenitalium]VEU69988.1 monophosphate biosynthesis [Mycoplasmopsis californica]
MNLLVLVYDDFQDIELATVLGVLHRTKQIDVTYFNPDYKDVLGVHKVVKLEVLKSKVNLNAYDGILIVGGKQAQTLRKDKRGQDTIKHFLDQNKYVFAICDAPNVIYESNLIPDRKYASYPMPNFKPGKNRVKDLVCVDGKLVTGKSPYASHDFAIQIVRTLFGDQLANELVAGTNPVA